MKRIFLDTNFIIDYLVRKDYAESAEILLTNGQKCKYRFFISYLTVANFAYIMRKAPAETLRSLIQRICETFTVVQNNRQQILDALKIPASDFEDSLQYQAAVEAECECIITRNGKDFSFSQLPVMTATEYVEKYFNGLISH